MSTNWGGGTLSAYGVVWGTTTNPTVASHAGITTEDIALYYFFQNSLITPINPDGSVTYYIRTYATNEIGTAYGTEIVLTPGVLAVPVVETTPILNLIGSIAEGGGNVISDGGDPIITAGICWGLTADPTVGSHLGITTDGFTGQFYSLLSGLTLGTTYHFRAYATNSTGTSYGADLSLVATAATLGQMTSGGNLWGTVFSVDGTGLHGLITQSWAYGIDTDWGCANTTVGTSTSMGTGSANTIAINLDVLANSCPTTSTWGANAPYYAATGFGPDWYLPSKDELNLLYTTRIATGMDGAFSSATPTTTFWSSSEVNATNAWYFDYVTGTWVSGLKTSLQNFFAIRSF